ncbi:DNA cytosine methyltransferase [Thioalkalivibrio sp. ALE16]|uniref:DNA cytosine methyltransferase n=1 Tax=Thioalkalivibrio sp. ALE16 TaxID=1158172 RepID=UPI001E4CA642|nr:DNA cytosine methyltransferase [Thioalkalivibrio sp. ALE16]
MRTLEMCAGAGGQALGLHLAGAQHTALIELDPYACETLRQNNARLGLGWGPVLEEDLRHFARNKARAYRGRVDLVAAGVPCPPFSKAGRQLGNDDDRDLFPAALEIVNQVSPEAVLLENVPGLLESKFDAYRESILERLKDMGFHGSWQLLQASDFGVPQLRPRAVLVAVNDRLKEYFQWPEPRLEPAPTVGESLYDLMASKGWTQAREWAARANNIAPTLVGGSHKHGGPDLGPTRAKRQWQKLGVYAHRLGAEHEIPDSAFQGVMRRDGTIKAGFENMPLLTIRMAARIQGFPDYWRFSGSKTHAYRQIGNAFPPPVSEAVGRQISLALEAANVADTTPPPEEPHPTRIACA